MAHDPDTIFKVLRPVPEFDGNPNVLTRFIKLCDQICAAYLSNEPGSELSNLCLLNGILNKITGPAATTLNSNGIPESWHGIRTALINNFSDQRDETALYNDLSLATQGNSSPQEFYARCQTLFSTIMTYVTLHETLPTTIEAKRVLYKNLTKQAFVRGLKEPLGSRIRCMRPDTVEKALEFVQEELNVMYLQQRGESFAERKPQAPKPLQPSYMTLPLQKPFSFPAPIPMPNLQRPLHVPQQQGFRPNVPPQYNMPTRTQQMFRALPPNYKPHSNTFRLPNRNPPHDSGSKPMSGVSHYVPKPMPPTGLTGHDWRKYGNPPPSNYFKSREMNFNECADYDSYYYPEHQYDYYDYNDNDDYTNTVTYDYDDTQHYQYHDATEINDTTQQDNIDCQPSTSSSPQDFQKTRFSKKPK
ncbi:unnamed protein product [Parnassius mnemosyne]|uniref:Retrovirus-related Gag polyprotein from transposon HMS-Beagle n=1 Tax=Parnassius mnemosyne TaxID=213953 RepID=A0AAV1LJ38_9NEOP